MKDILISFGLCTLGFCFGYFVLGELISPNEKQNELVNTHKHIQTDTTITIINGKADTTYTYKLK